MEGKVKFFNRTKGFGFIAGDDGKEYFVHQSGLTGGFVPSENDTVSFTPAQGDRGPKAEHVTMAKGGAASPKAEKTESDEGDDSGNGEDEDSSGDEGDEDKSSEESTGDESEDEEA